MKRHFRDPRRDIWIMGERARPALVRFVLTAGVLVTLGTGAAVIPRVSDEVSLTLPPGGRTVVHVSAHPDAVRAKGNYFLDISARGHDCVDAVVHVEPRDPKLSEVELTLKSEPPMLAVVSTGGSMVTSTGGFLALMEEDAGGDEDAGTMDSTGTRDGDLPDAGMSQCGVSSRSYAIGNFSIDTADCPDDVPCERTFVIYRTDGADDEGNPITLTLTAAVSEQGPDEYFCRSGGTPFGPDASVKITIDE